MRLKISARKLNVLMGILLTYRISSAVIRILEYLHIITDGTYNIKLYNGLQFKCRAGTSDFRIIDEIFVKKIYDKAFRPLGKTDTVIDIGANIGIAAIAAAAKGAAVTCFEPIQENLNLLHENIHLNNFNNRITVFAEAVAGNSQTLRLFTMPGDTGGAAVCAEIHPDYFHNGTLKDSVAQISVPCITLSKALSKAGGKCSLLKIDCEGAEYDIFESTPSDVLQRISRIILEYHPRPAKSPELIEQILSDNDFEVEKYTDTSLIYAERKK